MFEIYLVAQGESTAMVGGEAVLLQAGDLLAVDPGEVHTFVSSSEDICISWFRSRSSHVTSAARSRGQLDVMLTFLPPAHAAVEPRVRRRGLHRAGRPR